MSTEVDALESDLIILKADHMGERTSEQYLGELEPWHGWAVE